MKLAGAAALLSVAIVSMPVAVMADAASTAAEVRVADEAFNRLSGSEGPAAAFRDTMDEVDGLQFNGATPTRGAQAIYKETLTEFGPVRLSWKVTDAWGSNGGDMGVTTGTWSATPPKGAPFTGRYVTVWRKNVAGAWKGLIDIGNPDTQK